MLNLFVLLVPMLTDAINKYIVQSQTRFYIALFVSLCLGILFNYPSLTTPGAFHGAQFLTNILLVVLASQGIYLKLWDGSKLRTLWLNLLPGSLKHEPPTVKVSSVGS